jgi:hypothetical protein
MTVTSEPGEQIPFSFVTTERTLTTTEGAPVWPIRHQSDREVLRTIANSFGGTVVECRNPIVRKLTGNGEVIALGKEVVEEAELYAHLTLRECVVASNLRDLRHMGTDSVVVTTENLVNEELLHVLNEECPETNSVGLIYAATLPELRQQVLVRSAAAHFSNSGSAAAAPLVQRIDLLSTIPISSTVTPEWQLLGAEATPEEMKLALSAGAGVLSLVSHSDGMDAPLTNDAVLCAVPGARASNAPLSGSPACIVTGVCYRRHEPVHVALASGFLIFPEIIKARIMVADLCWGLLPPQDVVDPAWGVGRRLLENCSIGAFITGWEIMRSSLQLIAPLSDAIANGTPVGKALAEQRASEGWKKFARRMCLIGDPRVCVPTPAEPLILDSQPEYEFREKRSLKAGAVEFLRAYVTLARQITVGTYDDHADEVLSALSIYQKALWTNAELERTADAPGPILREAFVKFVLGRFGVAYPIWHQFADDWTSLEPKSCYACRRRADVTKYYLCIPGAAARRVTNCQSCGTVEDVPINTNLTFSVASDGEVKLNGMLPAGQSVGGLMLETSLPDQRRVFRWPNDENGKLVRTFRAAPPWPAGPIRVSVFIILEDCEFISIGWQCRGERVVSAEA